MRQIRVISLKNQAVIADKCLVAESFLTRLRGLMGKTKLEFGQGMLFPNCNDIHMWFMRMPLDVVFLTQGFVVSSAHENVHAWKALPLRDGSASHTLELPIGMIRQHDLRQGDRVFIGEEVAHV